MDNMFGDVSVWAVPFATFGLMFHLWPFVLLGSMQQGGTTFGTLIGTWCVLAVVRVFIEFDPQPLLDTIVWSDPLRTSSFVFTGLFLMSCLVVRRLVWR